MNSTACYKACAESEIAVLAAISNHWSHLYLEIDKAELPLEEFRHEAFRNIGSLIESYLFPHLRDVLMQVRLIGGKAANYSKINELNLGNIVNELKGSLGMPEFLSPPPWGISLNQWRNIAQHHSSCVRDDLIYAYYGESQKKQEIILSRTDLWDALKTIYSICDLINTARTLFVIDNIQQIKPYLPQDLNLRNDALILSLATAISTQGFELADIQVNNESVIATVVEMSDEPPKDRMIHASQFVYPVWCKFEKDLIVVNYLDKDGKLRLKTTVSGKDCERIANEEVAFSELANFVHFEVIGKDGEVAGTGRGSRGTD